MKKEITKNSKNFYLQLIAITVASSLFIVLMTVHVNKRINTIPDSALGDNLGLLEFGVFINSYPAVERLADYYSRKELDCESTREALGVFLGYACKGYYRDIGLDKAKSYRREFLVNRDECVENDLSAINFDFSCDQHGHDGEHDIVREGISNKPFQI